MHLATWNVNSLRARLPRVLEFLHQHHPDVLCLQETKCAPDTFPEAALAEAGYAAVHHSAGQWAGVAILAPAGTGGDGGDGSVAGAAATPFADVRRGLDGEVATGEARWIEATVAGLRVISTYVPNGRSLDSPEFVNKLVFLESAARRARELAGAQPALGDGGDGPPARGLIIAGDVNIAPADADVYDPSRFADSTHVSSEERSRLAALERSGDLIDAYRAVHPDTPQFTWWDYRAGHFHKGLGLRIDLILISAALTPSLRACGIERDYRKGTKPSDHAPLVLEFADPI